MALALCGNRLKKHSGLPVVGQLKVPHSCGTHDVGRNGLKLKILQLLNPTLASVWWRRTDLQKRNRGGDYHLFWIKFYAEKNISKYNEKSKEKNLLIISCWGTKVWSSVEQEKTRGWLSKTYKCQWLQDDMNPECRLQKELYRTKILLISINKWLMWHQNWQKSGKRRWHEGEWDTKQGDKTMNRWSGDRRKWTKKSYADEAL